MALPGVRGQQPTGHRWRSWAVPVAVAALVLGGLYALRPGVVENGVRSPRVWLAVAGVVLAGRLVALVVRRATGRPRAASVASNAVVLGLGLALLAPSFQQRTLDEPFPVVAEAAGAPTTPAAPPPTASAASTPAAPPPTAAAAPPPPPETPPAASTPAAPPPDPGPRLLSSGRLDGVGHAAAGRTALYDVGGAAVLRFEGVDIEGTPGPEVHLVRPGARTPKGGVRLGGLKAERGSFSYALPAGVDPQAGWTVLVWCRPYATPIAASDH